MEAIYMIDEIDGIKEFDTLETARELEAKQVIPEIIEEQE